MTRDDRRSTPLALCEAGLAVEDGSVATRFLRDLRLVRSCPAHLRAFASVGTQSVGIVYIRARRLIEIVEKAATTRMARVLQKAAVARLKISSGGNLMRLDRSFVAGFAVAAALIAAPVPYGAAHAATIDRTPPPVSRLPSRFLSGFPAMTQSTDPLKVL